MSEERQYNWRRLLQPRVVNAIMAGSIVALGILYIGQVNASANKALQMSTLDKEQNALRVETQLLAAKIDELRSLDSVMQRQQLLGLVEITRIDYVSAALATVALR